MTEGVALYDAGRVAIAVPEFSPDMHRALAECHERLVELAVAARLAGGGHP